MLKEHIIEYDRILVDFIEVEAERQEAETRMKSLQGQISQLTELHTGAKNRAQIKKDEKRELSAQLKILHNTLYAQAEKELDIQP